MQSGKVIVPIVHRENGHVEIEFDATFDGNYIGTFATHSAAENALNEHVLDLCERGLVDLPLGLQAEQALIAACAVAGPPVPPSGDEPGEPQPAPPIGTPFPTFTADDHEADARARSWSRRLLRQIVEDADASRESYASL